MLSAYKWPERLWLVPDRILDIVREALNTLGVLRRTTLPQKVRLSRRALMDRKKIMLAALAPGGCDHTPVQIQKLLFLIDREIPDLVDGPHFTFTPYDYGPFDSTVYGVLDLLQCEGLVASYPHRSWTNYRLTADGQKAGDAAFSSLDDDAGDYVKRASAFVLRLSFTQLVKAIYKAYPDMRTNSVFQG